MNQDNTVHLDIPAHYQHLSIVSAVIAETLQGFEQLEDHAQVVYAVQLAVQEVCVNIAKHGYNNAPGKRIRISIELVKDPLQVIIQLLDQGEWFDISQVPEPDMDNPQVHGYGLFLIRQIMDDINYTQQADGNIWRLVKNL
jgi:serine/threonine-protein kinase RsbW